MLNEEAKALDCKTCGETKSAEHFWRQKTKRGYFAECKVCQRKRNQKWIDENRDRFRHLNRLATNRKRRRDPVRGMLSLARARCRKSGLPFALTPDDIVIPDRCPILGVPLVSGLGHGRGQKLIERDDSPSLDRIDNSQGYVPGNVVVVSYRANRIKSDSSVTELLKIARFYAQLAADQRGALSVSAVQSHAQEEEGQVPSCQ